MTTFPLHADFNQYDGTPPTNTGVKKYVDIRANEQVLGDNGVIFDDGRFEVIDGVLNVDLPSTDCDPYVFGYTLSRDWGRQRVWNVPAQPPNTTTELATWTATTPLPIPTPDIYVRTVNGQAGDVTVSAGSSLTVQDENGNVSTGVSQIDFQGAGVTASAGTGEVVVTIPGGSSVVDATTNVKGIVELATSAETTTGTDAVRAVTPAGLAAVVPIRTTGTPLVGQVPVATSGTAATWANAPAAKFDPRLSLYNATYSSLTRWHAALGRALVGTGVAKVLMVGDSTTAGEFSGLGTQYPGSPPYLASRAFLGAARTVQMAYPFPAAENAPGWTLGSGWGPGTGLWGSGGGNTSNTNTAARTDTCKGYDVYQTENGALGTGTATLDAGAPVTLNASAGPGFHKFSLTASLGSHTISIARTASSLYLGAVDPIWPDGTVAIYDGSFGGKKMTDLNDAQLFQNQGVLCNMIPWDLVTLDLGINDFTNQTLPATYKAATSAVIAALVAASRDVLLIVPTSPDGSLVSPTYPWALYVAALYQLADQYNLPLLDLTARYGGTRATMNPLYYTDGLTGVHMSALGYADKAQAIANVINPA